MSDLVRAVAGSRCNHLIQGPRRPGHCPGARDQARTAIGLGRELGMTGPQGVVPRAEALIDAG